MNSQSVLQVVCLACLAVLPLSVLGIRFMRPRFMPWWAAFSTVTVLGWGLILVSAMLSEETAGGSGHVGALFLGWAFALAWFAPWLLAYAVVQFLRRRLAGASGQ